MDPSRLRRPEPVLLRFMDSTPLLRRGTTPSTPSTPSGTPPGGMPSGGAPPGPPPSYSEATGTTTTAPGSKHPLGPILVLLRLIWAQLRLARRFFWGALLRLLLVLQLVLVSLYRFGAAAPGWVRARLPRLQGGSSSSSAGGGGGGDASQLEAQDPAAPGNPDNNGPGPGPTSTKGKTGGGGGGTKSGTSKFGSKTHDSKNAMISPDGEAEALATAQLTFPSRRYRRLSVSGAGLLCGPRAVARSVGAQLPAGHAVPSEAGLQALIREAEEGFGVPIEEQTNNYSVDRLAVGLRLWGLRASPPVDLQLGYVLGTGRAFLVPSPPPTEGLRRVTVWICNNNMSGDSSGSMDHYEGIAPREQDPWSMLDV